MGGRFKIFLFTLFAASGFVMLFLALIQNDVHAEVSSSIIPGATDISADTQTSSEYQLFPYFVYLQHIQRFDMDSDDSSQRFLDPDHPFIDKNYIPADLVTIESDFTANNSRLFMLRQEAAIYFADMAWNFWHDFSGDKILLTSAYRSKSLQDYLLNKGCSSLKCAQGGTSEHQAGLAVDIKIVARSGKTYSLDAAYPNKYFDRFKTNAHRFGFHNTYQKGVEIDGKIIEGRHRRYVGTELATILHDNDQTLAEYYKNLVNN